MLFVIVSLYFSSRVFLFQEGDRGSKDTSASRGLFKMYYKGSCSTFSCWMRVGWDKEWYVLNNASVEGWRDSGLVGLQL